MLILNNSKFIQASFTSEEELEKVVFNNFEYIFGPSSFYIPKSLIKTSEGIGTIPDGYAINISERNWYIVEAELSKHNVWTHIAPQVAKQIVSAQQPLSKRLIIEVAVNQYLENEQIREKFIDEGIPEIDIRRLLDEITGKDPIVGIPIDKISDDLRDWAKTLRVNVKLWIVKKIRRI